MRDEQLRQVEELCLALAQLAHELHVETHEAGQKCRVVFNVHSARLEAAAARLQGRAG